MMEKDGRFVCVIRCLHIYIVSRIWCFNTIESRANSRLRIIYIKIRTWSIRGSGFPTLRGTANANLIWKYVKYCQVSVLCLEFEFPTIWLTNTSKVPQTLLGEPEQLEGVNLMQGDESHRAKHGYFEQRSRHIGSFLSHKKTKKNDAEYVGIDPCKSGCEACLVGYLGDNQLRWCSLIIQSGSLSCPWSGHLVHSCFLLIPYLGP